MTPASVAALAPAVANALNPYLNALPLPVKASDHKQWVGVAEAILAALPDWTLVRREELEAAKRALRLAQEIMDYGVPGDPRFIEDRRQVDAAYAMLARLSEKP